MGCPRCEPLVIENNRHLQSQSNGEDFIINVLIYPKPAALGAYIARQNFAGNILYIDSTQILSTIFNTPNNAFAVPYITKVSLQSGRLISEYSALGIRMSYEKVQNIRAKQDYLPLVSRADSQTRQHHPISVRAYIDSWQDWRNIRIINMPVDSFPVHDAHKISRAHNFSLDKSGRYLILDDFLNSAFLLYSLNADGVFVKKTVLAPTAEDNKRFISPEINPVILSTIANMNLLVSMYLNASFAGDDIFIMASLPALFITESEDHNLSIGSANQPVCLTKNREGDLIRMIMLEPIQAQVPEQHSLTHTSGVFFAEENIMVFQLSKGWPVRGTGAVPESYEESPFNASFYTDAKTLLFYDLTTNTATVTAPLNPLYAQFKLGYFFNLPMVRRIDGAFYWTDRSMGRIYRFSEDFKTQTLIADLFEMENVLEQMPFAENLAYLESYTRFFYRRILDFNISPQGRLTALVRSGNHFKFYEVDERGRINISAFPDTIKDKEVTNFRFGENTENQQIVYGLYQNNQQIAIYKFKF